MIIHSVSRRWCRILIWFTIWRSSVNTHIIIFMCISLRTRLCRWVVVVAWARFFVIVRVIFGGLFGVNEEGVVVEMYRLKELIVLILRLSDEFKSKGTVSLFRLASPIGFLWWPIYCWLSVILAYFFLLPFPSSSFWWGGITSCIYSTDDQLSPAASPAPPLPFLLCLFLLFPYWWQYRVIYSVLSWRVMSPRGIQMPKPR